MIRYEIREKTGTLGDTWRTVAWFDSIGKARDYWSTSAFDEVEAALVKVESKETVEHYHSADGKKAW